jgi:hypothetical protein
MRLLNSSELDLVSGGSGTSKDNRASNPDDKFPASRTFPDRNRPLNPPGNAFGWCYGWGNLKVGSKRLDACAAS